MGKDKAKLILGGRSVLEGILRTALEVSENAVVMRAPGQDLPRLPEALLEKVRVGHDLVEGQGPLQGITDALHLLPENSERVYVLTCDLPYLNREWLLKLSASLTEEWDAVVSVGTLHAALSERPEDGSSNGQTFSRMTGCPFAEGWMRSRSIKPG